MRIKLTRSIILPGADAEEGEVYEVSLFLALDLIRQGSAIRHLEEGEKPEPFPTVEEASRMKQYDPASAPKPRRVAGRR